MASAAVRLLAATVRFASLCSPAPCAQGSPPEPVPFAVEVPVRGVDISGNALLEPFMRANIDYLLTSFDTDHMLYHFRVRAGRPAPSGARGQIGFWDTDLKGSNAGRFLMGAGNALRWTDERALRGVLDALVDGVEECRDRSSGYVLAFPPEEFMHSEQANYARSWFTQGMIEAGKCGNSKVWRLLRGQYDWFNNPEQNPYLPYIYDGLPNAEQGQIASTRMYLETPVGIFADSQVAQDTYRDDFWMRQLITRDPTGISDYHMPDPNHAHCYEITSFLSMFDNYRATGNVTWLEAARSAWDLVQRDFLHVDGSSALTEGSPNHPAKTYHLDASARTGETCCTAFWIKFNQRFHLMSPDEERYTAEIEKALYNALLRQMAFRPSNASKGSLPPGIRAYAPLQGTLWEATNYNSCCEGQGSRMFGSLPEYIYSLLGPEPGVTDGLYVNLFAASSLQLNVSVATGDALPTLVVKEPRERPPTAAPLPLSQPPQLSWRRLQKDGWRTGAYCGAERRPACPRNVTTLEECKALCLASEHPAMCMGLTWNSSEAEPSPSPRCALYTSIDLSAPPIGAPGLEQWLVVGRRVRVQRDYPGGRGAGTPASAERARPARGVGSLATIKFTMDTGFPYENGVTIRFDWTKERASAVFLRLKIRMPWWLPAPLTVSVNGQPYGRGEPASYLGIDRNWAKGDFVSFTLPTVYRLSFYEGADQVRGYEGKRYALLVGPVVMACVGPMDVGNTTVLPVPPGNVTSWLVPTGKAPLHFWIRGADKFSFKPLWALGDGELFTTYPIFGGAVVSLYV